MSPFDSKPMTHDEADTREADARAAAVRAAQAFAASPLMKVLAEKHDERVARRRARG